MYFISFVPSFGCSSGRVYCSLSLPSASHGMWWCAHEHTARYLIEWCTSPLGVDSPGRVPLFPGDQFPPDVPRHSSTMYQQRGDVGVITFRILVSWGLATHLKGVGLQTGRNQLIHHANGNPPLGHNQTTTILTTRPEPDHSDIHHKTKPYSNQTDRQTRTIHNHISDETETRHHQKRTILQPDRLQDHNKKRNKTRIISQTNPPPDKHETPRTE